MKATDAVMRKLQKTHQLSSEEMELPASVRTPFVQWAENYLKSPYWADRRDRAIRYSFSNAKRLSEGTHATLAGKLDDAARDILLDYARAFYLQNVPPAEEPDAKPGRIDYRSQFARRDKRSRTLSKALANHIANQSYDRLSDLGLNERSALSLNGTLVSRAVLGFATATPNMPDSSFPILIEPQMGTIDSDEMAAKQIKSMQGFWRNYLKDAKDMHEVASLIGGKPGRQP